MRFHPANTRSGAGVWRFAGLLALAMLLAWPAAAREQGQQEHGQPQAQGQSQAPNQQTDRPQQNPAQQQSQAAQQDKNQQGQAAPAQNADRPVVSRDRVPDNASTTPGGQTYGPPDDSQYDPRYGYDRQYGQRQRSQQQFVPPPALLTIPSGTVVVVRINNFLSSDKNQAGDAFAATLQQPIVVDGYVVARRGQTVTGHVRSARKAGRVKGTSELGVELTDLTLVDGQQVPVLTSLWQASGGTSHGADAGTIAGSTILGAAIGGAIDWGRGAAIGAGAGALAGIGAVLLTRGRPTVLPPEWQLSFKLVDPVKVDTTNSASAFVPPTQQDFGYGRPALRRGPPSGPYGPYPGPYPYYGPPCGYYYPCSYGYNGPYGGYYPGYRGYAYPPY